MAPRNNDANASYKKKNFPVEDNETDVKDIVPCLLHKKHKVVKLVKSQLQKIQEEGLLCDIGQGTDVYLSEEDNRTTAETEQNKANSNRVTRTRDSGKPGPSKGGQQLSALSEAEEMDLSVTSEFRGNMCMCGYILAFLLSLFLLLFLMVWISAGPISRTVAHTPIPVNCFVRTDSLCTLEKKYLLRWSKPEYFE